MKTGDHVRITYKGRTVDGHIRLASDNEASLALCFDAMLGGYVGMMPVLRDDDGIYRDLIEGQPLIIKVVTSKSTSGV